MRGLMVLTAWTSALLAGVAAAQQPAQQHVRGEVVALSGDVLSVKASGGEVLKLKLVDGARVNLLAKGDIDRIADGAFIGTAAVSQPDGSLRAVEVHVFPDSMRGTGEGHRPWDLQPGSTMTNATVARVGGDEPSGDTGSTMTNATVAKVVGSGGARRLLLRYKDGEKTVVVPAGTPVFQVEPGDRSKLVPGAHLFAIVSRQPDGTLVAERLNVGKDGLVPPM